MSKLLDTFNRKHDYLRISVTDRCNLRCHYCMPEEGIDLTEKSHIMTLEEIIGISKTFVSLGVKTIRLTGGEPLVRKDFGFLISQLARLPVTLKLTTNGILLDKYFDQFEETGLKKINISLDSLDQAKNAFITKRDYFLRIQQNIEEALKRNFEIKLNVVLLKGVNDNEIPNFIAFTRDKNISVKFIEFMPFKGNKWSWEKGVSQEDILTLATGSFGKIESIENPPHSTSVNFKVSGFNGSFGIISTITNPFCSDCNRLRLTVDGKLKNCLFATSETDLLGPYRSGEDIESIIKTTVQRKKYSRDGMVVLNESKYEQNRAMTAIGG